MSDDPDDDRPGTTTPEASPGDPAEGDAPGQRRPGESSGQQPPGGSAGRSAGGGGPRRDTASDAGTGESGPRLAVAGALGFLTRVPVGTDLRSWEAFRRTPWAFVVAGYLAGALVALPFAVTAVVPLPAATVAVLYLLALVAVTGINHADGVADLADAAAAGGDPEVRHRVLKDSAVGVGGAAALAGVVAGLALAAFTLASIPPLQAAGIVLAAEVSGKLGMAIVACLGRAAFDGLGAQLTRVATDQDLLVPVLVAMPAAFASWPSPGAGVALVAGVVAALATWRWGAGLLGGVTGDVFGAANELARLAGLHAGVVAWTLL